MSEAQKTEKWFVFYVTESIKDESPESRSGYKPDEDNWRPIMDFDLPEWLTKGPPMQRILRGEAVCYDVTRNGRWFCAFEADHQPQRSIKGPQKQQLIVVGS